MNQFESRINRVKERIKICEEVINSPIYPYLKEIIEKPKEYFTEEVTLGVNNHLKGTGWRFYGKREEKRKEDKTGFFLLLLVQDASMNWYTIKKRRS